MIQNKSFLIAILALAALCARTLAVVWRNRRTPAPAREQLSDGVGLGAMIAIAIISLFQFAAES